MRQMKSVGVAALAALAACSGAAFGQTDVIVGELMDVSNYTSGGAINGKRAYSVGTTSCNLGTQRLTWIDEGTSVLYPVISQNMYRLNNGRLEQIGQAWLKHGFCALNGTACDVCPQQSNPACAYLMPQCSDPYTSGLNGDQGGLGPKHEVNASTGAFPANALVGASSGNATLRGRLQVNDADVTTSGPTANALFFVSSIYIHPEDAQFATDNNNSSYRRITVNQSNKAISLTDTTRRQIPPIFAWREYGGGVVNGQAVSDPSVVLTPVDVPNDGRLWVGSKVIPLGGGQYRYEYAVQNLNSHRGSNGFSVPLPAGAVVTNVGFKDVEYHSGELQQGNDWVSSVSSSAVTWNMPDVYTDDRQENVLRWDTMYNFWFECNIPSAGGVTNLSLFGTGAPGSMTAVAAVPSPSGQAEPFNNSCASPFSVGAAGVTVDTVGASTDGGLECVENGQAGIINDVWYTYTTQCAGNYSLSLCNADFDSKIALYSTCPTGDNQALACSDDYEGCGTNNSGSRIDWTAPANTTYLVRVGSRAGASVTSGTGLLAVDPPNCNGVPNDDCADAQWMADGAPLTGTTVGSTPSGLAGGCSGAASGDVFFKYRPQVTGFVRFDTCGSNFDTVLNLYSACGTTQLGCNDDRSTLTAPICSSNQSTSSLRLSTPLQAGTTYILRLSGWGAAVGNYTVVATGGGGTLPPANDSCTNRAAIGSGSFPFNTSAAATEGAISPTFGQIFNDVWFNKPVTENGTLTVTTCGGATFDTKLAIYESGNCVNLESKLKGWSDNAACDSNAATVEVPVTPGTYVIRVGGTSAAAFGAGALNITFTPTPVGCDDIDFNNDQSRFDPQDIEAFLSVYGEGPCVPANAVCNDIDFNNDTSVFDPQDIEAFLSVYGEGPCIR